MALSRLSTNYIEDILTCSVCLELLRDPGTLQQCLHTYCKICIKEVMKKQENKQPGIICPICGSFSTNTEICNNFFINDLLQMYQNTQVMDANAMTKKYCEQCPENDLQRGEVEFNCLDCKIMMCKRCQLLHLNNPLLRNHQMFVSCQETELKVDYLILCELHNDQPIKFFCTECSLPICIDCKVTVHNSHIIQTVETALKEIVPKLKENTKYLSQDIDSIDNSIELAEIKLAEVDKSFMKCRQDVAAKFEERICELQLQKEKSMMELDKNKEKEIKKITDVQETLANKKKEGESIRRTVLATIGRARNAALLTFIIQGELGLKVERYRWKKPEVLNIKLNTPKLNIFGKEEEPDFLGRLAEFVQGEVCKKIEKFSLPVPLLSIKSGNNEVDLQRKICYSDSCVSFNTGSDKYMGNARNFNETFDSIFSKSMKRVLKIDLPTKACKRLFMIQDSIWIPAREENKIIRFNKNGELHEKIEIDEPISIFQVNNDILIATSSGISSFDHTNQVCRRIIAGDFTDLCGYNGEVYCLKLTSNQIVVISCDEYSTWNEHSDIQLQVDHKRSNKDTLLVVAAQEIEDAFHIYMALWSPNLVVKFDRKGVCLGKYGEWPKLNGPLLCGVDVDMKLLVANGFNIAPVSPKILDMSCDDKVLSINTFGGEGVVSDIIFVNTDCVWVICAKNNKYGIEKYTH